MADTETEAALRRKAKALEDAGGDPAKIAELRHMLPAERKTQADVQTKATAEVPADGSESKAKDAEPVKPPAKPGRPRMAATRGLGK